jgi:hypothetical protein
MQLTSRVQEEAIDVNEGREDDENLFLLSCKLRMVLKFSKAENAFYVTFHHENISHAKKFSIFPCTEK